jgi:hypothetical protein
MKRSKNKLSAIALMFVLLASACYERTEGCLDLRATNYNVRADDPCEDCCTFPTLSISVLHRIAAADNPDSLITFNINRLWALAAHPDDLFQFTRVQFYLSNIEFLFQDQVFAVTDTIRLWLSQGGGFQPADLVNDFQRIEPSFSSATLGSLEYVGPVDLIRFTIGLAEPVAKLDQTRIPNNHPLAIAADSVNFQPGFGLVSAQVALLRDTVPGADSLGLRSFQPITLGVPVEFDIEPGFNVRLQFRALYHELLQGADIRNDSPQQLQSILEQNLSKFIELVEIRQE